MDSRNNYIGAIILAVIIVLFSVGGFVSMKYFTSDESMEKGKKEESKKDFRIDTEKDYIYLDNEVEIIDDIFKRDAILNVVGLENITEDLSKELASISATEEKVTADTTLPEDTVCEKDLYRFKYRDYIINEYSKYISLIVVDYEYTCPQQEKAEAIKSYVINKETGKLITNDELLQEFKVSTDDIIKKVTERLEFSQVLDESNNGVIDSAGTIEQIKNGAYGTVKALSINKTGKLELNYIVKSNDINYNDSVELN